MASTVQKKTLHSILAGKLNKLSIPSSTSTPGEDFDFSDVFGPQTSQSASSPFLRDPEIIYSRSHSFVGPSPRFANSASLPFKVVDGESCSQGSEGEEENEEEHVDAEKLKEKVEEEASLTNKMGPGDFQILGVIGQGAFGKVFQVRKKDNGGGGDGIFAMKVMKKDTIIKKNHVDYMKGERDILTKVVHPFIVQLRYSFQVMLTDFGLAKEIEESSRSNSMCGTTEYMAPEILSSKGHNKDADWWSIGILLYEMLTGQPPFTHANRQKLQQRIIREKVKLPPFLSSEAHSLLKGLLQKEPSKRLGSGPSGSDEIKNHKWFRPINWKKLEARQLEPKFKPNVNGRDCTANFDKCWTEMPADDSPAPTPTTTGEHFRGYTYVAPAPWLQGAS
ncbi:PREDICTED: serine/threonine-protein kinase AtPK2/AtPK19-like isoform X2 [Nelumbo nucifera]|uniref:Serine/threonine-protein kinase AtPK2/AtPK19-like n=2 Tax=Nelumbo nucifera TaxID=4432 RepID=A0A822YIH8_NELNU|nr:PREDICTED: serine/threonine-protein kinase AtPK2/AtPK19-like isoform X2 [Nelumbo nucifera]DAD31099.1 TPA_asm: hypothetical protein HUJ06_009950 [Nelumbo nucifera]